MSPFPLLRLLADGSFHPGAALSRALGCTRPELDRALHGLRAIGVDVSAVRGQGYRLARPIDLIRAPELANCAFRVEVLDECESTNTLLVERAREGRGARALHALAAVCERQTAGRGRRGVRWHSAIGASLTFSVLWTFSRGASGLAGLSLAAGVAAARVLARLGARHVGLKWPNDLLVDTARGSAKLGGILIEIAGDPAGPCSAVIGIGLNVRLDQAARDAIGVPAADLGDAGVRADRTALLAALLDELANALEVFEREGFAAFRDEWMRRHAFQGRRVALRVSDRAVAEGEAIGVAEDGALQLLVAGAMQQFHAGELSLRPV